MEQAGERRTAGRIVLDSGPVIRESRGEPRLRAFLREALRRGTVLIVPPIVVSETFRGDPRDVFLNRLMQIADVSAAERGLAEAAGRLLAETGGSNAADAQVVAEALRQAPCTLLTSDAGDVLRLLGAHQGVGVIDINTMRRVR